MSIKRAKHDAKMGKKMFSLFIWEYFNKKLTNWSKGRGTGVASITSTSEECETSPPKVEELQEVLKFPIEIFWN